MRVSTFLPALAVLLISCYEPDLSGVKYRCDDANPTCPLGLRCVSGTCQLGDGNVSTDGGAEDKDLAMSMTDGSNTSPADLAVETPVGCSAGREGFKVGANAFACRGKFGERETAKKASELCNEMLGYQICENGQGIDREACPARGFFASKATACRNAGDTDPKNVGCAAAGECMGSFSLPLLVGCGRRSGDSTLTLPDDNICSSLKIALDCSRDVSWDCFREGVTATRTANRDGESGVLCCK